MTVKLTNESNMKTLEQVLTETGDYCERRGQDGHKTVFTKPETRGKYFRLFDHAVSGSYSGGTLGLIPTVRFGK